jgi:hypothetical protein
MTDAAAVPDQQPDDVPAPPPIVLFLPAVVETATNKASAVADLVAQNNSLLQGTFTVERNATFTSGTKVADQWRILRDDGVPVLDLSIVDYRTDLRDASAPGTGLWANLGLAIRSLAYFIWSVVLFVSARRRAKSRRAKWQLVIGLGFLLLLFAGFVGAVLSVIAAVTAWDPLNAPDKLQDAVALGWVAVITWALIKARPKVEDAAALLHDVLDYTRDEQVRTGAATGLRTALDSLFEQTPAREIHIVGYSFGCLVALDLLFPKQSGHPTRDERYGRIQSLTTIGCPVDFLRLYFPGYPADRECHVRADMPWDNIFIPADVFGSNFLDRTDTAVAVADAPGAVLLAGRRPTSRQYTDQRLSIFNVFLARGFATHTGYWVKPNRANCLHMVRPFGLVETAAGCRPG